MNKKINTCRLIIGFCLLSFGLSSCSEWLDVKPKSEIKEDELFKTEQGFKDAMTGVYVLMTEAQLYGREMTFGLVEAIGQQYEMDQATNDYYDATQFRYEVEKVTAKVDGIWSSAYKVVANINNILENLETNGGCVTPPVYAQLKAECLGLRAFIHFDLLRLFGWGNLKERPDMLNRLCIPYAFQYTKEIVPQVTVGTALEYMEKDLTEAEKLISHDVATSRFTFNYYALLATRMRIAMWKGDYSVARKYAENLLNYETDFAWVSRNALETSYPENRDLTFSSEYLFGLSIEQYKDITDSNLEFKLVENQDNPQMFFHTAEIAAQLFEVEENIGSGDYRYKWLYAQGGDRFAFLKLKQHEKSIYGNRVPLMKKAEIYYTLAECLNESGNESERQAGVGYLNTVRSKRNIPQALDVNISKDELREEIQKEWRKEMLLEGQMFYYYKRRGISSIPRCNITMTDQTYVLPLPQAELEFGGRENNK